MQLLVLKTGQPLRPEVPVGVDYQPRRTVVYHEIALFKLEGGIACGSLSVTSIPEQFLGYCTAQHANPWRLGNGAVTVRTHIVSPCRFWRNIFSCLLARPTLALRSKVRPG